MIFITIPPIVILYSLAVAFSGAQFLVNIGFIILGMIFFLTSLETMETCSRFRMSEMWPTTWGRVYSRERGERFPESADQRRKIGYLYAVDGTQYFGHQIDAHNYYERPFSFRSSSRFIYREEVLVFYHPTEPGTALLVPGVNWSAVAVFMGCAVACWMVLALFLIV